MKLIDIKSDNTTDYKKTALFIAFPYCSGKCGELCQNKRLMTLSKNALKDVDITTIVEFYDSLKTHNSVVMGGLEPLDSIDDVITIIYNICNVQKPTDIVIYTGYTDQEYLYNFEDKLINAYKTAKNLKNKQLIVKVGRFDPSIKENYLNKTLGVKLATSNQLTYKYYFNSFNELVCEKETYTKNRNQFHVRKVK